MLSAGDDVEDGVEGGRLAGGREHGRRAAFQRGDLCRHMVIGGVLQPGVEIAAGLQVEQLAHGLAGLVSEGGGLNDGNVAGLSILRPVAGMKALGADFHSCSSFPVLSPASGWVPGSPVRPVCADQRTVHIELFYTGTYVPVNSPHSPASRPKSGSSGRVVSAEP